MAYIQDWGMRVQAQPQINTTRRAFLHLSQNENGRMLNIRITDVNIPAGSTAVLAGTKPDGTVYSQTGTLAGNTATFAEDVQMTAVAGTWDAKITVTNGGNCICTARITITIDPDTVAGGAIPSDSQLDGIIAECRAIADSVRKEAYGSPLTASTAAAMTDQSRVYVYTGSESGMTAGHWYYYNGTTWSDGGVYNAVAVDTDTTLSIAGKAADAKEVGDQLTSVKEDLTEFGAYNLLNNMTLESKVHAGITYTWNDDGSCSVSGTATATSYCNMFASKTSLPEGIAAGDILYINYSGSKVLLRIYDYSSGTPVEIKAINTNRVIKIPDACVGLIVRVWVANGNTVNETVKPEIFKTPYPGNTEVNLFSTDIYTDADEIDKNCIIFVSSGGGVVNMDNVPYGPAWIETVISTSTIAIQKLYPYTTDKNCMMIRVKAGGVWGKWVSVGEKGYIEATDADTDDESAVTNMTAAIEYCLNTYGHCKLGEGVFYVNGVDMPDGATLEGTGRGTIVRLLASATDGYCVSVKSNNTVRDICFSGGYGDGSVSDVSSPTIGERDGIRFLDGSAGNLPCIIDGCRFARFSGSAIYQNNTGGGQQEALIVTNCYMQYCEVGINIDYYSEYCKYVNVITFRCYYACINNGGNNVFVGCTFHGTIGFLLDNTNSDKVNTAHGSCIGCVFNHIDNWNHSGTLGGGDAVRIIGGANGFIFDGCQIWYGFINIQRSIGISFNACLLGDSKQNPHITTTGNYPVFFNGCIFHQTPVISAERAIFNGCYVDSTGAEVTA